MVIYGAVQSPYEPALDYDADLMEENESVVKFY